MYIPLFNKISTLRLVRYNKKKNRTKTMRKFILKELKTPCDIEDVAFGGRRDAARELSKQLNKDIYENMVFNNETSTMSATVAVKVEDEWRDIDRDFYSMNYLTCESCKHAFKGCLIWPFARTKLSDSEKFGCTMWEEKKSNI